MSTTPKKITDLATLAAADPTDIVPIVDVQTNTTRQVSVAGLGPGIDNLPLSGINGGATAGVLTTDASGNVSALQVLGAWTSYTPATVGWAATPTTSGTAYMQIGKTVFYRFIVSGTSNNSATRVELPVAARNDNNRNTEATLGLAQNNGTYLTNACRMYIEPATSTTHLLCQTDMSSGAFAASGAKTVRGMIVYEAA